MSYLSHRRLRGANKYGARKVVRDGIVFDSLKEARRYTELCEMEEQGFISNLRRQVNYELTPSLKANEYYAVKLGVKKGSTILQASYYVADFVYLDKENKQIVVEDCKGYKTKDYILKKKFMFYRYGILIKET